MDNGALRAIALNPILKRALRLAGWILSLVALAFFARLVLKTGISFPDRSPWQVSGVLALGAAVYGFAVFLLSTLWVVISTPERRLDKVAKRDICSSYMTSQFAKYLPGNVFQYAARHALGRRLGIPHGTLASAALLEATMLASASAVLVLLFGMPIAHALFPSIPVLSPAWSMLPLLVIPGLYFLPRQPFVPPWIPTYPLSALLTAFIGYLAFFLIFGLLFLTILDWVSQARYPVMQVIGGSSAAWLVGFAVPGAPAGAGLREAALSLATGTTPPAAPVLSAIILFRLVTLGGDLLAFIAGTCWSNAAFQKK